jgi:predicted nucleic acid-binding protein
MGTVVLDTSVLIGFLDSRDAHYRSARSTVERYHAAKHSFTIPTCALAEALVGEARRGEDWVSQQKLLLAGTFGDFRVIDEEVAVAAALLRAKHRSLRLPDALVLAVGIVDKAQTVVTADKRWRNYDDRVVVLGEDLI